MVIHGRSFWPLARVSAVVAAAGLACAVPVVVVSASPVPPATVEAPRQPVAYTVPDEGRGSVDAFGDHFVVVAGKTIRWDGRTTYRLMAGRISVGMIAQWKGKRAGFTGDVLASQLTLSK